RFALLRTWRKSGAAVDTPVWFVVVDGRVYVVSRGPGKVKRIRTHPAVAIAACNARGRQRGELIPAVARVIEGDVPKVVRRAFRRRYGPLPAAGRAAAKLFRADLQLLEITNAVDGGQREEVGDAAAS